MAHNINSIAYTGEKPWHGLGTKVDHVMTSAEAIAAAKMDWKVEKKQIMFQNQSGFIAIPDNFATVRMDTMTPLGVVGRQYRPLQNKEAFSFFDAIVGEKAAMYHTVGALGAGERIWLLAKLPGQVNITKDDVTEKFLLLTNSHDGTSAVQIMFTPIRVVCQNTLNMALGGWGNHQEKTSVRHTTNMGSGINEIRRKLGIAQEYFNVLETVGKHLVSKQANGDMVDQLLADLGLSKEKGKASTRTQNIREEIQVLFQKGKGNDMPGVKGSAWALLNGVVEYVDYHRSARGAGDDQMESRTNSLLFGSGSRMKQKALESVVALTK